MSSLAAPIRNSISYGREIQRAYGQEPEVRDDSVARGARWSQQDVKSLGNYIGINEPPEQIYGKTMSISDVSWRIRAAD
jgi:tyrosyl-tRNA synthetase